MNRALRAAVVLGAGLLAGLLVAAILALPVPAVRLPTLVAAHLPASGVTHPVTAVLLNFRGYDTLLEVAVLALALVGLLAQSPPRELMHAPSPGEPVLPLLARVLVPFLILSAGYLLWSGAHRPGGAFQAGAVLAAAAVVLHLARLWPAWDRPGRSLRLGLVGGLLLFLAVAAALLAGGTLLRFPPQLAGTLILLIEIGLTVSLGLLLAGLFLFLAEPRSLR